MEASEVKDTINGHLTATEIADERLAHFREKAIIAESKITEKINKALEDSETAGRRWFWELLQNAKDTATYNPNKPEQEHKNVKEKAIDVVLTYGKEEENYFLKFEHNGNPFSYTDDPYRFDDVTNLILPVSGKDDEYQTGKFGTGFLSTHILSLKIKVEGTYFNREHRLQDFSFMIDRTKFSPDVKNNESRNQFIESIVDAQRHSVNYREHIGEIKSKFTYYLNDNIKKDIKWAKKIVEEGLNDLDILLPFILCFNERIRTVTIKNEILPATAVYEIDKQRTSVTNEMELYHVVVSKDDKRINILLAQDSEIQLATYFENDKETENKYFINLENIYKNKTEKSIPFLYSSFPLIGSEEFTFPMVINSKEFKPKETRDSISLKNNESGNQSVIEKARDLYKKLLKYVSNEQWKKAFNIANTNITVQQNHKWISDTWHQNNVNKQLRESILKEKLLDIPESKEGEKFIRKAISETIYFPINSKKETLWKFTIDLFPQSVPSLNEITDWNKVLWDSNKDFKKVNAEFLVKKISEYRSDIKVLAQHLFGNTEDAKDKCINWLYDFVKFIHTDLKQSHLLDLKQQNNVYPILPSRKGQLKPLSELYLDKGHFEGEIIDDKTISLHSEFCDKDVSGVLLDEKFNDLNLISNRELKEDDLASRICEVVNHKIRNGNLSAADKNSFSELRNYLFELQNEVFDATDEIKKKRKEKFAELFSDIDLDKLFLAVVEPEQISSVTKLLEAHRTGKIDIKTFGELAEYPEIIALAEMLLKQREEDNFEFKVKKQIGDIFERYFRNIISKYEHLTIAKVEGEEDFIIYNSQNDKQFYIEIKSATLHKTFIELSPDQGNAFSKKSNYILCIVPDSNLVTDENSFIQKAIFNNTIGGLLKGKVQMVESFEAAESGIEVIYETELLKKYKKYKFKYRIYKSIWQNNKFDDFLKWIT